MFKSVYLALRSLQLLQVFYSRLLPLLKPLLEDRGLNPKEVKISEIDRFRKDWPLADLITATKQLIAG